MARCDGGSAKCPAKFGEQVARFSHVIHRNSKGRTSGDGSLYLYTSDLGTTLPPDLGTYTFTYIGFRQNRLRYYMINGTKVHQ